MASVGLRFFGQRAPLHLRLVGRLNLVRYYSQPRLDHFAVNEYGLLSSYLPAPWRYRPSIFTRAGLESVRTGVMETFREMFSYVLMKYHLSGWSKRAFATQAEVMCEAMNEAFAEGNVKTLGTMCFPSMAASLKNDIKRRKSALDWRKVRSVEAPKIVQIRCGRLASNLTIGQVVVRIDQEQVATPRALGARSSGSPVRVTEYVVFQRIVSDPASPWRIFCKLGVPKWDQAAAVSKTK
ncbi:hypothetical protein IWW38_005462 [Coemansia aciculifera]|uniref:Uncharacterized protein n=1 Tax=Coemansia aciculifera TaxID=417176 RepID=A0ACC1LW19_9FUNG|nr:hypothetical protein IWW38_005462 [Coemansia aciculifera]